MFLNIVTNNFILKKLQTMSYYKTDLGGSFRDKGKRGHNVKVSFKNPFLENYYKKHGRLLMKSGTIGSINVYTDYGIHNKSIHIYSDGNLYDFEYNDNDFSVSGNMQKYLSKLLKKIENDHKIKLPPVSIDEPEIKPEKTKSDSDKLMLKPGSVTWEDLQAYKKK